MDVPDILARLRQLKHNTVASSSALDGAMDLTIDALANGRLEYARERMAEIATWEIAKRIAGELRELATNLPVRRCAIASPARCERPAVWVLTLKLNGDGSGAPYAACCNYHLPLAEKWAAYERFDDADDFIFNEHTGEPYAFKLGTAAASAASRK